MSKKKHGSRFRGPPDAGTGWPLRWHVATCIPSKLVAPAGEETFAATGHGQAFPTTKGHASATTM